VNRRSAAFGGETRSRTQTGAEADIREMEGNEAVARRAPRDSGGGRGALPGGPIAREAEAGEAEQHHRPGRWLGGSYSQRNRHGDGVAAVDGVHAIDRSSIVDKEPASRGGADGDRPQARVRGVQLVDYSVAAYLAGECRRQECLRERAKVVRQGIEAVADEDFEIVGRKEIGSKRHPARLHRVCRLREIGGIRRL